MDTLTVNGVEYVRKPAVQEGMTCAIVRTYSAGVFYGYIKSKTATVAGMEIELVAARRMWQFYGASLSQIAASGTPDNSKCKFPEKVTSVLLINCIEILPITQEVLSNLDEVPVWKVK